jgi:hypothetical protein
MELPATTVAETEKDPGGATTDATGSPGVDAVVGLLVPDFGATSLLDVPGPRVAAEAPLESPLTARCEL